MGLGTPCLSMGLDRLNNLNNPRRQTPAGKAGQRLNGFCCNCIPVLQLPEGKGTGQVSLGEKKPPDRRSRRGVGLLS
jgi:hypothetical protein